jgi:hypothetical protein
VWTAQRQHYCHAMDGWMYFCDKRTAFNQLLNFPIQSNAAAVRCWPTPSCTPSAPESSPKGPPRGRCPRGGDAADLEGVELNFIDRKMGCTYMYVRRNRNYLMTAFN